jgi:hypothetical protein
MEMLSRDFLELGKIYYIFMESWSDAGGAFG